MLPALLEAQARIALDKDGDPLGAHDLAVQAIELAESSGFPTDNLLLIQATALARSGSPVKARRLLESCLDGNHGNLLAYGALARTYRDLAREEADSKTKQEYFLMAAESSEQGLKQPSDGENLAELIGHAYLLGQIAQFTRLGGDSSRSGTAIKQVIRTCDQAESLGADDSQKFWLETNRAEMALLEGDLKSAAAHYCEMASLAPDQLSSISANASVCRMLLAELGHPQDTLDHCFSLPPVVIYSGHMFDLPGRKTERFPAQRENALKAAIADWLDEHKVLHGHGSASAGADLLFAEALLERGGRLRLVLPFSIEETRRHCVAPHGEDWSRRYDDIIAAAEEISVVEDGEIDDLADSPAHYRYTNRQLFGGAALRAARMALKLQPLVIWDAADTKAPQAGGTGDFVALSRSLGIRPLAFSPADGSIGEAADGPEPLPLKATEQSVSRRIRTFLFADVKGFSSIPDSKLRKVATDFLKGAAEILHGEDSGVILCNTWGDALFVVFDSVEKAAATALKLRDGDHGGPSGGSFNMRISLHAGPVYISHDPVIDNEAYIGSNVVRAARMEPIAEVGQVLVSDELAALLATNPDSRTRYDFHYLGLARLPKGYGRMPAYELDHATC